MAMVAWWWDDFGGPRRIPRARRRRRWRLRWLLLSAVVVRRTLPETASCYCCYCTPGIGWERPAVDVLEDYCCREPHWPPPPLAPFRPRRRVVLGRATPPRPKPWRRPPAPRRCHWQDSVVVLATASLCPPTGPPGRRVSGTVRPCCWADGLLFLSPHWEKHPQCSFHCCWIAAAAATAPAQRIPAPPRACPATLWLRVARRRCACRADRIVFLLLRSTLLLYLCALFGHQQLARIHAAAVLQFGQQLAPLFGGLQLTGGIRIRRRCVVGFVVVTLHPSLPAGCACCCCFWTPF